MDDDCSHEIKRHLLQYLYFKLNLQEDSFIELFAMQHEDFTKEDLMELKAQRKDKERQEEEVTEESQCRKQESDFLYLRSTVSLRGTGPEYRTVHESCSSYSACNPGLPWHL